MGDQQPAGAGDDRPSERFPCSSQTFGLVTLAGLAVVFVLVLFDGRSLGHWTVVAAVVLIGLGTWLTMVRPAVHTHDDHVLVRNALTDTKVPWHLVESVDVRQVLVIRTADRVVHGIAIGLSARQQMRQNRQGGSRPFMKPAAMLGGDSAARVDYVDFVAQRLDELSTANQARSRVLDRIDKRWRLIETGAVVAVLVAFAVLLAVVIAG